MQIAKPSRRNLWGLATLPFFASRSAHASLKSLPRATAQVWNRTELYFGSAKPDGSAVTETEFMQFVDHQVTPRFPDGLTILTGYGQFRGENQMVVHENSHLLILFYPPSMTDANTKIQEIRTLFNSTFQQESVLRADSFNYVSF